VDNARIQIREISGAEVELKIEALEDTKVLANPDMLGIAIQNLLLNAADVLAGLPFPKLIEVKAAVHFEKARILVRDNGPGMPENRREDPFSPGLSLKKGGMGLGLSIVRDCIEAMGGSIGLRPYDGSGACFEITLACSFSEQGIKNLHNPLLGGKRVQAKMAEA
jgi:two-component system CitB family sensor kinase